MTFVSNVQDVVKQIALELKATRVLLNDNQADLAALTTNAKSSLLAAINEINAHAVAGSMINDTLTSTNNTWSAAKVAMEINEKIAAAIATLDTGHDDILATIDAILDELIVIGEQLPITAADVTTALGFEPAPLASPDFIGQPKAPTPGELDSSTRLATTFFVQRAINPIAEMAATASGAVRYDRAQTLTDGQKFQARSNIAAAARLFMSEMPPADPDEGQLWWSTLEGTLKVYYFDGNDFHWVDASSALVGPGAGYFFQGASVGLSTSMPNVALPFLVPWQQVEYDTSGFFDSGLPTQFVVPPGISRVSVHAGVCVSGVTTENGALLSIVKNPTDNTIANQVVTTMGQSPTSVGFYTVSSRVIPVTTGDIFKVHFNYTGTNVTIEASGATYFAIQSH